jgi:dihydrofolate reductase
MRIGGCPVGAKPFEGEAVAGGARDDVVFGVAFWEFEQQVEAGRDDWAQSTIARGDLADEIGALKLGPDEDMIAWGGAAFAQSLSRLHLVDEYRLIVQPVALDDGLALFAGLTAPFVLDLVEARAYADGSVLHVYPRAMNGSCSRRHTGERA